MDVDDAKTWDVNYVLGDDLPVADNYHYFGGLLNEFCDVFGAADAFWLEDRKIQTESGFFDCAHGNGLATAFGSVWLGVDADDLVACGDQSIEGGHSELGSAQENSS